MSMDPEFLSRYLGDEPARPAPGPGGTVVVQAPAAPAEPAAPARPAMPAVATMEPRAGVAAAEATVLIDPAEYAHLLPPTAAPPRAVAPPAGPPAAAVGVLTPRSDADAMEATVTIAPVPASPAGHHPAPAAAMADSSAQPAAQWGVGGGRWDVTGEASASLLRADDASLVRSRKVPPTLGWRRAVWVGSAHTVNLGAGPYERALLDDQALIGSNIAGNYQIAVVSVGGGVGKTAVAAGLGTAFALHRTDQVIAIDAAPSSGKLGRRIDPRATSGIADFIADRHLTGYPMARQHTGKNPQGLEVLAGNQNVASAFRLGRAGFDAAMARTRRFYQLAVIDCAPDIDNEVMGAVLGAADALVIVGTCHYDGAVAAETTINWLAARNRHELLRRSTLVLNDVYNNASAQFVEKVDQALGKRVGSVATLPWDEHLRDTAVLDWDGLRRQTARAFVGVAATLARGFATAGTVQTGGARR